MEGNQKKMLYPERYKNTNRKGLWSEKDNEVSQWDRHIWRNMYTVGRLQDQHYPSSSAL